MAKLQAAIDDLQMESALEFTTRTEKSVDIIELGTPFLMRYGLDAVALFRERFPEKEILADLKIMDAGYFEAKQAFEAGADYVTVLGVTDFLTIRECQRAAGEYGRRLFVDTICVPDLAQCVNKMEQLDVYGISVHVGVDQQSAGRTPMDDLTIVLANRRRVKVSVAGGISAKTAGRYVEAGADILISGGGIFHAEDPVKAAEQIVTAMRKA